MIISKDQAVKYSRVGLDGLYYQLSNVNGGTTIASAIFTGEHGERTIGSNSRIYYILEGGADFQINDKKLSAKGEDIVVIPPNATYNFWPKGKTVRVLLIMELLDMEKLPR